jgi:hypothetical protein
VDTGRSFGHGDPEISRAHIVSFMGSFVKGLIHPFVCNETLSKSLICISFFMVRTLSDMCKERKRALQCHFKLEHIEFHVHWKLKDIAMNSPIKYDILFIFFLKGPSFFMEKHFIALGALGKAYIRKGYGFLLL